MSMRTGQTGAHRSARVGRVIEPVHLSAGAIPRQTLLIVNHGVVAVSGVAPRRSLEAEMLRCRGVDLHQIWLWAQSRSLRAEGWVHLQRETSNADQAVSPMWGDSSWTP